MVDVALKYIELGLPVIPICPPTHSGMSAGHRDRCRCPGKSPLIKGWQTRNETTAEHLAEWQRSFREFNLGLPLGDASGYVGIDVDGEAGVKILKEMSSGDLPSTWEFSTAAGSRLLYRIPQGLQTKKFKQTGEGAHEECALLCTGQQTVVPPSIHHTGYVYEWVEDHSPWDIKCGMAPDWLIELITYDGEDILRPRATVAGLNWEDEFKPTAPTGTIQVDDVFSLELPEATTPIKTKKGKKKSGSKLDVEELLTRRIPEGERDNTMTQIVGHYCANRDLRRLGKETILGICMRHNQQYCDPPLEDSAILSKVNYFLTTESMKDEAYAKKRGIDQKPPFEPSQMVEKVLEHLADKDLILHFDQFSKMYYYTSTDQGPWMCTRNYALIQKWIRAVLVSDEYGDPSWDKRSFIEETRMALEEYFTNPYKRSDDFDLGSHQEDLSQFIVLNNGVYRWMSNTLEPWDPRYKTTIAFDIDFDPVAECPHFERYLKDWLPDETVRMVLQEYLGLCLVPNTNFRKAVFLYGKGRNGKSILIEFLQRFFGELSSTLSYDGLFTRFGPAALKDKLVNIFDDTNVSFTKETSIAKNLIAGGKISAEFKGKDAFEFTNTARLIFSSQETPRTGDTTLAWYDRWFFIHFPNTFRASNQMKEQINRNLAAEIPGIFNWMIQGLRRLHEQDGFSASPALDQRSIEYRAQNDSVVQFFQNLCCVLDADDKEKRIPIPALYKVYQSWAAAEALRPVSKKIFIQRAEDSGFERKKGFVKGRHGQTYFEGLTFNMESEDYAEHALEINLALTT